MRLATIRRYVLDVSTRHYIKIVVATMMIVIMAQDWFLAPASAFMIGIE